MHDVITYCGQLYFQWKLVCLTFYMCIFKKKKCHCLFHYSHILLIIELPFCLEKSFNDPIPILHETFNFSILGLETTRSKKSFWNRLSKVKLSAVLVLVNLEVEVMSRGTKAYLHTYRFVASRSKSRLVTFLEY